MARKYGTATRRRTAVYKRRGKYGAIKTVVDNITFHSKKEAARYIELKALLRSGKITDLELQPKYAIVVNDIKICTYIADFLYIDKNLKLIVEDVKGVKTGIYRLKKKLLKAIYGIEILET